MPPRSVETATVSRATENEFFVASIRGCRAAISPYQEVVNPLIGRLKNRDWLNENATTMMLGRKRNR
jgi:hypothetical protein